MNLRIRKSSSAQLEEVGKNDETCCDNKELINDNEKNVCRNCGQVHGYDTVNEFIDFYENMYRIRRKSVYHRKYHIENTLMVLKLVMKIDKRYIIFLD